MEHDDDRFFSGASRGDYLDALTAHAGLGPVLIPRANVTVYGYANLRGVPTPSGAASVENTRLVEVVITDQTQTQILQQL